MFSEGLERNSAKWVSKGVGGSISGSNSFGNGGRGLGLPSPAKFRSGHLPSSLIPVPLTLPRDGEDSGSVMDESTDMEEEVYGGRYSMDSSPQDERGFGRRSANGIAQSKDPHLGKTPNYGSDSFCSDYSSSRDTIGQRKLDLMEREGRGGGNRYTVGKEDYSEDELSDSAMSSEDDSTHGERSNGGATYSSEGYSSGAPSQTNVDNSAHKDFHASGLQSRKLSVEDIPSAPPLSGSFPEANQDNHGTPLDGESVRSPIRNGPIASASINSAATAKTDTENKTLDPSVRNVNTSEISSTVPPRRPTFHASGQGPWFAVISYDACVRLCLHLWAKGCMEAPIFLENECELLQNAFGLQKVLLQPEEELLARRSSGIISEGAAPKPKKTIGKLKVQVRKVKMALDPPTGCSSLPVKMESVRSGCLALRKIRVLPRLTANGSVSCQSLAYVHASTHYIKEVSGLLKTGVTTLRNSSSSCDTAQGTYSCLLKLKNSTEEDAVRMQPGSTETHVFFPDSLGDDLIIEVQDSKGKYYGRVLAQLATITEEQGDKLRWWSIYHEPDHEFVGKVQLYVNYSTSTDENGHLKCGSVAETVAYDLVLEVAMKIQHFHQRNLILHDPWKWLLTEFASYYGVSDAYTKLRYLSYVMDVASPTADCLVLVHDLLLPLIMKDGSKKTLSHQENRILGEVRDQIEHVLALVFENYKALDESLPSGMIDVFKPATGSPAPALAPAIKLYTLLHDVLSPEAQLKLCSYFQAAAKKRSRRHLVETDEYVTSNNPTLANATAYQKMRSLCLNIRNEIFTDIEIHNDHILPSFIDLPNISSSIYSAELCSRLRAFLVACPPTGPSPPVVELVIAAADFQRDLANWSINPVKGGVDAKELFHLYIILWIQDKRLSLLESCKLDKVKWSGVRTKHLTTPFVDDMYKRVHDTLSEYSAIIYRWPEYTFVLENAIADVEKAILEALEKQYADVISPLKDNLAPKKFGLKYIQKLAKRTVTTYTVPEELGILLNTMKRMLDVLRPKIETQLKSWGSFIPNCGSGTPGERLGEITVMLRAKFRNYLQAVVEKLVENTKIQSATKLKKIIQESKATVVESDVRSRMQPLKDQLMNTIDHLHSVFETHVFVATCRGYWDRMGQDVLSFLENRKENKVWYKGTRITVTILDDTFASQMQQLLGNALQAKDLEPPRSIMEVRSMLCKDAPNRKDSNYYY